MVHRAKIFLEKPLVMRDKAPNFCGSCFNVQRENGVYNIVATQNRHTIKTPLGNVLATKNRILAEKIASELGKHPNGLLRTANIPLSMLLATYLDRGPTFCMQPDTVQEAIDFDVLLTFDSSANCKLNLKLQDIQHVQDVHRVKNATLGTLQTCMYTPLLDDFCQTFKTPMPTCTSSFQRPKQPVEFVQVVQDQMINGPTWKLVTLHALATTLKSILMALLACHGATTPAIATRASRLEESLQAANWGITHEFEQHDQMTLEHTQAAVDFYNLETV